MFTVAFDQFKASITKLMHEIITLFNAREHFNLHLIFKYKCQNIYLAVYIKTYFKQ